MPAPSERSASERSRAPAIALWMTFTALLLFGVFLFFRFGDRILPFLDVVTDR